VVKFEALDAFASQQHFDVIYFLEIISSFVDAHFGLTVFLPVIVE
jgi:hypothetical protein